MIIAFRCNDCDYCAEAVVRNVQGETVTLNRFICLHHGYQVLPRRMICDWFRPSQATIELYERAAEYEEGTK